MAFKRKLFQVIARSFLNRPAVGLMRMFILHPFLPARWRKRLSGIGIDLVEKYPSRFSVRGRRLNLRFIMPQNARDWLSKVLFWYGAERFEPDTRRVLEKLVGNFGHFVDIGAHIGFYSLYAKRLSPGLEVLAFEPHPAAFATLEANVSLNHLSIARYPLAVFERNGKIPFFLNPGDMSMGSVRERLPLHSSQLMVDAVRFDDFVKGVSLPGKSLVKIDTERSEPSVLRGMKEFLRRSRPVLICEILSKHCGEDIISFLSPLEYRFFRIVAGGVREGDPAVDSEESRNANWLIVPEQDSFLAEAAAAGDYP